MTHVQIQACVRNVYICFVSTFIIPYVSVCICVIVCMFDMTKWTRISLSINSHDRKSESEIGMKILKIQAENTC